MGYETTATLKIFPEKFSGTGPDPIDVFYRIRTALSESPEVSTKQIAEISHSVPDWVLVISTRPYKKPTYLEYWRNGKIIEAAGEKATDGAHQIIINIPNESKQSMGRRYSFKAMKYIESNEKLKKIYDRGKFYVYDDTLYDELTSISLKFPFLVFQVDETGEDRDDNTRTYLYRGGMQKSLGRLVFDDCKYMKGDSCSTK